MVIFLSPGDRLFDHPDFNRVGLGRFGCVKIDFSVKIIPKEIIDIINPKSLPASPANLLKEFLKGAEGKCLGKRYPIGHHISR